MNIIFAPNVRCGGGWVLLKSLLQAFSGEGKAFLDARVQGAAAGLESMDVTWVAPGVWGRYGAERQLSRIAQEGDSVLCFHGLPPLLPVRARVAVYLQNALAISDFDLSHYPPKARARIIAERAIGRRLAARVDRYIVQTPTMRRRAARWFGPGTTIEVVPFAELPVATAADRDAPVRWDFLYPAFSDWHKNHRELLQAWTLLAEDGVRPTLALTIAEDDSRLADAIGLCRRAGARVECIGALSQADMAKAYLQARTLIFPSLIESFGLPLIEASHLGRPIIASDLDYVHDVCAPVATFDPRSAGSIASAVRRFRRDGSAIAAPVSPKPVMNASAACAKLFA